jgi:DNA-binding protein YbaB
MTGGLADSVLARIVSQRGLIQAMDEHCKSMSARVTSPDRTVSVAVDGLGAMTGLSLGEFAYRNGADALAKLIVETAHAAAKVALDRQNYLLKEFTERLEKLQTAPFSRRDGSTFRPAPQVSVAATRESDCGPTVRRKPRRRERPASELLPQRERVSRLSGKVWLGWAAHAVHLRPKKPNRAA